MEFHETSWRLVQESKQVAKTQLVKQQIHEHGCWHVQQFWHAQHEPAGPVGRQMVFIWPYPFRLPAPTLAICTLLSMVLSAPSCHVSRKHHYYCCPIAMFFAEATKINSIFLLCAVKLCWVFYTNLYYKLQMCVIKCNYRLYIYIYYIILHYITPIFEKNTCVKANRALHQAEKLGYLGIVTG